MQVKMKKILYLSLLLLSSASLAQQTKTSGKAEVLLTIDNKPVYADEFVYLYDKNHKNLPEAYTKSSLEEYLDLFSKFKAKVLAAEKLGLDKSDEFVKEFEIYKKKLATPYLTDRDASEKLSLEAYERLKTEIKASHILIRITPDATPEDSLVAYKKIEEIRKRAVKGEDFAKLAKEFSQDPSVKDNLGNLGYFTALRMVYPFETAAYKTPVGKISEICRTKFGYHIIKVDDKRPSRGVVTVAHIMLRAAEGMAQTELAEAENKIKGIYQRLQQGEAWSSLCQQFSEDLNTVDQDGKMNPIESGSMYGLEDFEDAAFALQNPNDYSKPIKTPFGWHIIKLVEKSGLAPYEQLKKQIDEQVKKDSRSELNQVFFLERLKKEYKFKETSKNVQAVLNSFDTTLTEGAWKSSAKVPALTLFTLAKKKFTNQDFYAFVSIKQRKQKNKLPATYAAQLYEQFKNESLIAYEESQLPQKYPDYKHLLQEYRDGILLFKIMGDSVWDKANKDTVGLRTFFEQNKDKYQWDIRAKSTIYSVDNQTIMDILKEELKKPYYPTNEYIFTELLFGFGSDTLNMKTRNGLTTIAKRMKINENLLLEMHVFTLQGEDPALAKRRINTIVGFMTSSGVEADRMMFREVEKRATEGRGKDGDTNGGYVAFNVLTKDKTYAAKQLNVDNPLTVKVTMGTFEKGSKTALENLSEWKEGTFEITDPNGKLHLLTIEKVLPKGPKDLQENKGQVISDYQNNLEKTWVAHLLATYPVNVNKPVFEKLIKK